ncbi:MAG: hypothetical protein ACK5GV_00015 [Bacteroidota bacterium]|jgi:hypothetical protein
MIEITDKDITAAKRLIKEELCRILPNSACIIDERVTPIGSKLDNKKELLAFEVRLNTPAYYTPLMIFRMRCDDYSSMVSSVTIDRCLALHRLKSIEFEPIESDLSILDCAIKFIDCIQDNKSRIDELVYDKNYWQGVWGTYD